MQAFAIDKGTLLQGEYRLLEAIGGTESRVYLATRETSSTGGSVSGSPLVVARLWQPSAELLHAYGAQALFERALSHMRAATLLRHPILAMAETCGGLDDGTLFLISEHYEGTPLDAWIDSAGIPALPTVIDLAYRICSGLNAAHRNGLSHASLHPHNIIVRPQSDGSALSRVLAKLVDFGAPTCMFPSPPSLQAARFMAPEQLEQALRPAIERAEPTVRMNVYGCGALLYYLCTGGPPLAGRSVQELLVAHAAHKVLPPSRINPQVIPALDAIILKALEPEPRARYANTAELANALISIRFERSSSGVRARALSEREIERIERIDHTPRDRRVTISLDEDGMPELDSGLEERPTSKTQRLDSEFEAFPFERPTALENQGLPTPLLPTPLPPLTPLTPLTPPTPTPTPTSLAAAPMPREHSSQPPAVLARPTRKSLMVGRDAIGQIPPWAYISVAAAVSLAVIFAVISKPSPQAPAIAVTPLAMAPAQRAQPEPAPAPSVDVAGASPTIEAPRHNSPAPRVTAPREAREPRPAKRSAQRAPDEPPAPAMPEPDAPIASADTPVLRARPEPPPEPEPIAPSTPSAPSTQSTSSTPSAASPSPPKRVIAPLPETKPKPLAPLPEKAVPRFYDVGVKGSLATSLVRRGIERTLAATQDCYRTALSTRPTALGVLSLEVVVDERGRARSARASGAAPSSLLRCVENAARRLSVPPPDTGTVTATWKVSL